MLAICSKAKFLYQRFANMEYFEERSEKLQRIRSLINKIEILVADRSKYLAILRKSGVQIGEIVIVGCGSVVTKSIPPNEIWGRNAYT